MVYEIRLIKNLRVLVILWTKFAVKIPLTENPKALFVGRVNSCWREVFYETLLVV